MFYTGDYFDKLSSKSSDAEINIQGETAEVRVDNEIQKRNLVIKCIQNKQNIHFEDGSLFILHNQLSSLEAAQHSNRFERIISWLECFSFKNALILGLIFISAIIVYRLALLSFTHFTVSIFPASWERQIGENAYKSLQFVYLKPSKLPEDQIHRLTTEAEKLLTIVGLEQNVKIKFHQSGKIIGPNALAFPGGPIVVTDDLVELLADDKQVLAVIAHEIAHVKERHSLNQIIELVGISALAAIVFGANEALIEEASVIAVDLWALNLSRDFEREADLMGVKLLQEANIDPIHFATALNKIYHHLCKDTPSSQFQKCIDDQSGNWLSTHPTGAERLEYLKEVI